MSLMFAINSYWWQLKRMRLNLHRYWAANCNNIGKCLLLYVDNKLLTNESDSYNRYKLNSLMTYFQTGFIAQLVENRTGITEVMCVWIPLKPYNFFGLSLELCNCFSCFTTARITFTRILFRVCAVLSNQNSRTFKDNYWKLLRFKAQPY